MKRYKIILVSNAPMLQSKMTDEAKANLRTTGSKKVNKNLKPEEIAAKAVYATEDGYAGFPVRNVLACLISAGRFHAYKGKQKFSTRTSTMITMFCKTGLDPAYLLVMRDRDGNQIKADGFEVDSSHGVNPNTNNAVMIDRPKFTKWQLEFTMEVDEKEIDDAKFKALWKTAGQLGLGAWRPERRGSYGTFDPMIKGA